MTYANADRSDSKQNSRQGAARAYGKSGSGARPPQQIVKTWAFDSVGNRKYALQIKKASNGNPCLKIVEGVPQADGTFRKFDLTIWSEDFPRLFETLDEVRAYLKEHNIKTPEGHKFDPNKPRRRFSKTPGTRPTPGTRLTPGTREYTGRQVSTSAPAITR